MRVKHDPLLQRDEYGLTMLANKEFWEDKEEYGRKLHDEDIHNLCPSYNVTEAIESRSTTHAGH
jgi:hypothetical protein